MSAPEGAPDGIGEMLDQVEWYRDSAGNWWQVAEMGKLFRRASAERLIQVALPMAKNVFRDLYAYGMPSGEQAQMDLERGEAEVEVILESEANAQDWMRQTALYAALTGKEAPVVPEEPEEPPGTPYEVKEEARQKALAALYGEILRLEQVENQVGITLKALRDMRDSLL